MASVLELYEKLKPKLGEGEARALLEFVDASVERKAASKEDLQRTESTLRQEIQHVKVDLIKWNFALWLGNVAVLSGIILAISRAQS